MKKIAIILLSALTIVPAFAQLNGNGYYRVQNAHSKRFATLVDNKANINKDNLTSTSTVNILAIQLRNSFEDVVTDPGSVIYIEHSGNNGYILRAQGLDTYALTGFYLQIYNSFDVTVTDEYYLGATYKSIPRYLKEAYDTTYGFYYLKGEGQSGGRESWLITPVTRAEGQYIGVKPEIEVAGKYYTTLYASFPYQLSEGMKAYYVKQSHTGSSVEQQVAELAEIESGIVPAATPVIIECSSDKVSDNKITPLTTAEGNSIQNQLKGNYFCNVIKWLMDGEPEKTHTNWNATDYDANTMRILGKTKDGKLGFVKATDMDYLPANKAYLPVQETATGVDQSGDIALVDAATYATLGIQDLKTSHQAEQSVYSLTGIKVSEPGNIDQLPAGIYIVDGKKVIKK